MESSGARERIVDAALAQFAELGVKGATVRGIAEAAGVSAGLVQHHFPSKAALQEACDDRVRAFIASVREEGVRGGAVGEAAFVGGAFRIASPVTRYLAAALASGADAAGRWFEEVADMLRSAFQDGVLGPPPPEEEDVQALAAVQAAMQLGLAVMFPHMVRLLAGGDDDHPPGAREARAMLRVGRARLRLTPEWMLSPDVAGRIEAGFDAYEEAAGWRPGEEAGHG